MIDLPYRREGLLRSHSNIHAVAMSESLSNKESPCFASTFAATFAPAGF